MKNILITGIGGDLGQSISRILSESFNNINIYGSDINNENSGILFCKKNFILPLAKDKSYIDELIKLNNTLKIDLIIPSTEQEISSIAKETFDNEFYSSKVLGCFNEILSIGNDKFKTNQWLASIGIKVPKTFLVSRLIKLEIEKIFKVHKQLVVKKRISSGSRNIIIIDHVSKIPKEVFLNPSDWILQEWLPNDEGEYTIPVSILSSKMRHIQFKRILRYGSSGYAEIMDNSKIEKLVETISANLYYDSVFNIQLRFKDGIPLIFEINPRFSSTVYARHLMGFPDLAEWVANFLDIKKDFKYSYKTGDKFYRYFSYQVK